MIQLSKFGINELENAFKLTCETILYVDVERVKKCDL